MTTTRLIKLAIVAAMLGLLLDLAVLTATVTPAQADTWGPFHRVVFKPYGTDRVLADNVRIKHFDRGTRCDFERYNRFDSTLISIGVGVRSCIPGKILYVD